MATKEEWLKSLEGKYPKYIIEQYANYPESIQQRDGNGKLLNNNEYKNGLAEGVHYCYDLKGQITSMIGYKQGFNHGVYTIWYETGQIYCTTNYVNGYISGKYTEFYENGKISVEYFKDGRGNYNGDYILYDASGKIIWHEKYINNIGQLKGHHATNLFVEPRMLLKNQ